MTDDAVITDNRKTIAINISDPTACFALRTALSSLACTIRTDCFSIAARKFIFRETAPDLIIFDLRDCFVDKAQFEWSHTAKIGSQFIALAPTSVAATYFFRLQRAKIPICLLRNGLEPLLAAVRLSLEGAAAPPEVTLTEQDITYLTYGTKDYSHLANFPEQFRRYLARIEFDSTLLSAEMNLRSSDISDRLANLFSSLGVESKEAAIEVAAMHGISQLPPIEDPMESKIFEATSMSVIAKWLSEKTKP